MPKVLATAVHPFALISVTRTNNRRCSAPEWAREPGSSDQRGGRPDRPRCRRQPNIGRSLRSRVAACLRQSSFGLLGIVVTAEFAGSHGEAPGGAEHRRPDRALLAKTLHQYRSGVRQNEMMTIAAKELADAEIQNLAAYYAAIQIEVIPP
jgi:hypothetical protein